MFLGGEGFPKTIPRTIPKNENHPPKNFKIGQNRSVSQNWSNFLDDFSNLSKMFSDRIRC